MVYWDIVGSTKFCKRLKKYLRDAQVRTAFESCMSLLPNEEYPRRTGDGKHGAYADTYGYHLTKSIRPPYRVDGNTCQIRLLDIGDHKEVYGSG